MEKALNHARRGLAIAPNNQFALRHLHAARAPIEALLALVTDFSNQGRQLIHRYVKVAALADGIVAGLKKAGLKIL